MNRGQSFLLLLIGVVALLTLFIVLPFVEYVIAAALLAYVLYPIHVRLERRIEPVHRRINGAVASTMSALVLIFASLVAVIVPLAYITRVFVEDLVDLAEGDTGLDVITIEARIAELTGEEVDIETWLATVGDVLVDTLFGGVSGIVSSVLQASLGLALVLFLLYYTLLEGPEFVAWLRSIVPLPSTVTDGLFEKIDATTWGVVIGHISVALLPLIGAFLVWGPAAAYLVVIDQTTAGVLLAVYGVVVVSMVDNYARPIVIDKQAHLNPGIILLGVFGGVYSIGFTGLFVGPIVIGVLAATLETFREEFDAI